MKSKLFGTATIAALATVAAGALPAMAQSPIKIGFVSTFSGPQAAIGTMITIPVVILGMLIQSHLVKGFSFGTIRK